MEQVFSIAGAFGLLAFIVGLWRLQLKTFRSITLAELPHAGLWGIHYILLSGYSGAIICFISVIRAGIRLYIPQKYLHITMLSFLACIWVLCLMNYQDINSLFPPMASTCITIGLLKDSRSFFTNCTLVHYMFWILYGFGIGSTFQILASLCGITSCVIGKMRHENITFHYLLNGAYMRHLMRISYKKYARNPQ